MTPVESIVRSYLYVPGNDAKRLSGASARGADAVIADLEDSVALSAKDDARSIVTSWLLEAPGHPRVERWVRINTGERGLQDIAAIFAPGLTGICLPKVSTADDVGRAADVLDACEQRSGTKAKVTLFMPLIESALGLRALDEIAAAPRVQKLQIGEIDLGADLGVVAGIDESELLYARSKVVTASVAAGIAPPVGPVSSNFSDPAALAVSTQRLRRMGFVGRAAIHPNQLSTIHEAFAVSPEELTQAQRMVERYEAAMAAGNGVIVGDDGRMIDEAVVRFSRRIIGLANATNRENPE